ncbi:MAG: proprotein convertase P-domain-containing protein, partial [Bacteroidota bacterium]
NLSTWNETIQAEMPFTLPEGDYASEDNWTALQGCPLNGIWNLAIRDTQVTANGYLFNWQMQFAEDLDEDLEEFTPPLVVQQFVFEPDLPFYFQDSILVSPLDPGNKYFQLEVTNTFGCRYDTSIAVAVRAETSAECTSCDTRYTPLPDTTICLSDAVQINIEGSIPNDTIITYQSDPRYSFGFVNHPPDNPFAAPLLVEGVAQDTLTNPFMQIVSVCLNINTDFNDDIAIFLRAPDGKLLELSTNNGGGFNNYTNTCFSPLATDPITIGAPPFQGTFIPEGNWSDLTGSPINGTWDLLVSDAFDLTSLGELVDWEITFNSTNEFDINWSPTTGLSCSDCPNPIVNPSQTTNYSVSFIDSYGCSFSDNFTVNVLDTFAAPEIICGPLSPGNMIFNWNSVGPGLSYEGTLTINGVDSVLTDPILDTFLIVDGLVFGDVVTLQLNVTPPDTLYPCFVGQSESTCTFEDCFTFTQFEFINDVDCFGEATGSVAVRALRGFRPFTYYLNGDFIGQQDSVFNNLAAGNYLLVT